ncbi:hypothetical protein MNBD_DELTA03-1136 [hydrothermal vent metagenome]|uniref:Sulphur transport domain-containing protein n=1 Tax=hydrothermal vent metagenome TaxID=652676 RepID=A0A3B0V709_9ZZZZ
MKGLLKNRDYILMGAVIGIGAMLMSFYGNPPNTGLCISCFLENIAGAMGLQHNIRMQYMRPELLGLVIGAFVWSLWRREFVPTGGSSPLLRFLVGILLIIGCSVFIGCPVKMVLRLAAGDIGAIAGAVGLVAGIYVGLEFVENGFQLGKPVITTRASGYVTPLFFFILLLLAIFKPDFIAMSVKGSAALHAPFWMSLAFGLILGAWAQHTQFCITGGIARVFLWGPREIMNCPRSTGLLISIVSFFIFATISSMLTGQFNLALHGQPSSNESFGWGFAGMFMVGLGAVLVRGCPLRQMVAAGQGDTDAGVTTMGMLVGAALVQNWGLGGTPAGTPPAAQIAVLLGIALLIAAGLLNRRRGYGIAPEYQLGLD